MYRNIFFSADFLFSMAKMSIHRALNPLPSNMYIELGQEGHIKKLENLFKNVKFEQDDLLVMYDNEFVTDVIGSRVVSTILKYKAANSVPYIEQSKSFHEKVGLVTQRNLVIVLKIRSKLTALFFGILEDSDLPPIIDTEIREQCVSWTLILRTTNMCT